MSSNDHKRNRIMEFAFKKFTSMGIPHVTMDEISRGIGIGKGTLYKFFPSKEALISSTIDYIAGNIMEKINATIENEQLSVADKLNYVIKTVGERLSKINPSVMTYVERSLPEAYEKIVELRKNIIMTNMVKIFEQGKKTGIFEPDMDSVMTAHILIGSVDHITNEKVLMTIDYSLESIFQKITTTILKGCMTEEGRRQTLFH